MKRNWSAEDVATLLRLYGDGALFAMISERIGRSPTAIRHKVMALSKAQDPQIAEAKQRRASNYTRSRHAPKPRTHSVKPVQINDRAWTSLDDAIRTLQRFAPCYRQGDKIIYGRVAKTPDEIIELARRKAA